MRTSKHLYFHLSRRNLIKCAAGSAAIVGAPAILKGLTRRAIAQDENTIRLLITGPTLIPGDWSAFERETGFKMEDTVIKDDPGIFLTEILVNDGGDRFDIIAALTGAEQDLIDGEAIKPIETSAVPNWGGIPESITQMPYLQRDLAPEGGYVWGVPLAMNADSFGYLPEKLNEPRPPEEASWSLVYESEKTLGRSSTGDNYIYLWEALAYLKNTGQLEVADLLDPSPEEAAATADFLIERKQAGQFRNFWKIFDDQVSDMKNGEVDAIRCWEPAVREANKAGGDWVYANATEFIHKVDARLLHPDPGPRPRQPRAGPRGAQLDPERQLCRRDHAVARLRHGSARPRPAVRRRERYGARGGGCDRRGLGQGQVQVRQGGLLV